MRTSGLKFTGLPLMMAVTFVVSAATAKAAAKTAKNIMAIFFMCAGAQRRWSGTARASRSIRFVSFIALLPEAAWFGARLGSHCIGMRAA